MGRKGFGITPATDGRGESSLPDPSYRRTLTHPVAVIALMLGLTFLAYGGSLRNGFVWDDETLILNNRWVRDLSLWPDYFTNSESISSNELIAKTYRPIQTLSLAVDQRLWKGWPGGFHLTSLLIQTGVCVAVFFLFKNVVGVFPSLVAAIFFAVHPALSEGVLCLANRGGHLSALFGLTAAGLFLRVERPLDRPHAMATIAFAIALLAKEPAIALVILLPLVQGTLRRPWPLLSRPSVLLYAPLGITAAIYLAIRHAVVGSMTVAPWWGGSLGATLQLQAKVFAVYLRLLVWPFHLQGRYSIEPLRSFPDSAVAAAFLLNGVLLVGAVLGLRKRGALRLVSLAILWFYVALLPVSNLIPIPGSMLGERFVYFSFAGMFPLIAGAAALLPLRRYALGFSLAAIATVAAFVAMDIARTRVWANETVYFGLLSRQEPTDPVVQLRTAEVEIRDGKPELAIRRIEPLLASAGESDLERLRYWFARALLDVGRLGDARRQLTLIWNDNPTPNDALVLLFAETAARSGDLAAASSALERATRESAANDALWNARGNVAWMSGDLDSAASFYREAVRRNPRNVEAETNLRNVTQAIGGHRSSGR